MDIKTAAAIRSEARREQARERREQTRIANWLMQASPQTPSPFSPVGHASLGFSAESATNMRADHLAFVSVARLIERGLGSRLRGAWWLGFDGRDYDLVGFVARPRLLDDNPDDKAAVICNHFNTGLISWRVKTLPVPAAMSASGMTQIAVLVDDDWPTFMGKALGAAFDGVREGYA